MLRLRKFLLYWLPVLGWMGLIYFLSSFHKLQASEIGWQDFIVRKTAHFLEYAVLFVLVNRAFSKTSQVVVKKRLFWSLFLTLFYAFSDEYHQTFVIGRSGRALDFLIDSLGVGAGFLFVIKFIHNLPGRIKELLI